MRKQRGDEETWAALNSRAESSAVAILACYLPPVRRRLSTSAKKAALAAVAGSALTACGAASGLGTGGDSSSSSGSSSGGSSTDAASSTGNYALHFDGIGDYATSGTAKFPAGSSPQTISLWVRYSGGIGRQTFVELQSDAGGGIELGLRDGALAAWTVFGDRVLVSAPSPPVGAWHHVAFVYDGARSSLYIDGTSPAAVRGSPNVNRYTSSWFGAEGGLDQFFAGDMDEIRIWEVARSATEIVEEMAGQLTASEPGLVAHFNCNSVDGTRVPDDSGNGNDATLGGGDPSRMPTLVPSTVPP